MIAITIEAHPASSPSTMFQLSVNGAVVASGLAASETHSVVGKLLERLAPTPALSLPKVDLAPFGSDASRKPRAQSGRITRA